MFIPNKKRDALGRPTNKTIRTLKPHCTVKRDEYWVKATPNKGQSIERSRMYCSRKSHNLYKCYVPDTRKKSRKKQKGRRSVTGNSKYWKCTFLSLENSNRKNCFKKYVRQFY